jgi:hypothetical protein
MRASRSASARVSFPIGARDVVYTATYGQGQAPPNLAVAGGWLASCRGYRPAAGAGSGRGRAQRLDAFASATETRRRRCARGGASGIPDQQSPSRVAVGAHQANSG